MTGDARNPDVEAAVARAREAFRTALSSDLNTAAGLAAIFDLVRDGNAAIVARRMSAADAADVRKAIEEFDLVLGVISLRRAEDDKPPIPIEEIEQLIEDRRDCAAAPRFCRGRSHPSVAG